LFYTNIGLVQLIIVSSGVVALLVGIYLIKNVPIIKLSEIWRVAHENKQYPTLMVPASFIDALAIAAPIYFITASYGVEATGNYSQIQKLVATPLALAGAIAGQLFLKRSAELFRNNQASRPLLWKVFGALCVIAGLLLISLIIFGEYALGMLLGSAWRVDTMFLLLVTVPLILRLTVSPVSMIFITHNKIGVSARWQLLYFISTVIVIYFASQHLKFENFLALYALHEMVAYSIYLYLAHQFAKS
jgi:O-antigen/teichoic acid export membrane protein